MARLNLLSTADTLSDDSTSDVAREAAHYSRIDWTTLLRDEDSYLYEGQAEVYQRLAYKFQEERVSKTTGQVLASLLKEQIKYENKDDLFILCVMTIATQLGVQQEVVAGIRAGDAGDIKSCIERAQSKRLPLASHAAPFLQKHWGTWSDIGDPSKPYSAPVIRELAKACKLGFSKDEAKARLEEHIDIRKKSRLPGVQKTSQLQLMDVKKLISGMNLRFAVSVAMLGQSTTATETTGLKRRLSSSIPVDTLPKKNTNINSNLNSNLNSKLNSNAQIRLARVAQATTIQGNLPTHNPSNDDPTAMVDYSPGQNADDPHIEEQVTPSTIAHDTGHNVGGDGDTSNLSIEIGRCAKADSFIHFELEDFPTSDQLPNSEFSWFSDEENELAQGLASLEPEKWLSSQTISQVLETCVPSHCCVVDPLLYVREYKSKQARRLEKSFSTTIVPLYHRVQHHWTLAVLTSEDNLIHHYDSYRSLNSTIDIEAFQGCGGNLEQYKEISAAECPQQDNDYDCGIQVIVNALCQMTRIETPPAHNCKIWRSLCRTLIADHVITTTDRASVNHMASLSEDDCSINDEKRHNILRQTLTDIDRKRVQLRLDQSGAANIYFILTELHRLKSLDLINLNDDIETLEAYTEETRKRLESANKQDKSMIERFSLHDFRPALRSALESCVTKERQLRRGLQSALRSQARLSAARTTLENFQKTYGIDLRQLDQEEQSLNETVKSWKEEAKMRDKRADETLAMFKIKKEMRKVIVCVAFTQVCIIRWKSLAVFSASRQCYPHALPFNNIVDLPPSWTRPRIQVFGAPLHFEIRKTKPTTCVQDPVNAYNRQYRQHLSFLRLELAVVFLTVPDTLYLARAPTSRALPALPSAVSPAA